MLACFLHDFVDTRQRTALIYLINVGPVAEEVLIFVAFFVYFFKSETLCLTYILGSADTCENVNGFGPLIISSAIPKVEITKSLLFEGDNKIFSIIYFSFIILVLEVLSEIGQDILL